MFRHDYPYTDFHELNLDWFLNKFNSLLTEWDKMTDQWGGDLKEALERILHDWIESGYLPSFLNNLVIVNDYGATGDGETDDTEAINRCLSENPNATIFFKKGVYCISDTLHSYGEYGAQCLFFGSAQIKWTGAVNSTSVMLHVHNQLESISDNESRPIIYGGTFNANNKAGMCIKADKFHQIIDSTKCINFIDTAIHLDGYNQGAVSQQAIINNVMILHNADMPEWSEGDTVGILVESADNMFSNVNINRCRRSFYIKYNGNFFTNCHTTTQYKTKPVALNDSYGFYYESQDGTGAQGAIITNHYFDGHKACFYFPLTVSSRNIVVSDSQYFFNDNEITGNKDVAHFAQGGRAFFDVTNFNILPGHKCQFLDYYYAGAESDYWSLCNNFNLKPDYHSNDVNDIVAMQNLVTPDNNKPKYIIAATQSIPANTFWRVGVIMTSYNSRGRLEQYEVIITNRTYSFFRAIVAYNHRTNAWVIIDHNEWAVDGDAGRLEISFGNNLSLYEIDGYTKYIIPIYLSGYNGAATPPDTNAHCLVRPITGISKVYLKNTPAIPVIETEVNATPLRYTALHS